MTTLLSTRWPWGLALFSLLLVGGCGRVDEGACAGMVCTVGKCVSDEGRATCECDAHAQAAGLDCTKAELVPKGDVGGTLDTAAPLAADGPHPGGFDSSQGPDVDVYSVVTEARHVYRFSCGGPAVGDCALRLLDASGAVKADNQYTGPGLTFKVAPGRWFVEAKAPFTLQPTGAYVYRLEDLGVDDHGDTDDTATEVQPASTNISVSALERGDVDVLAIHALAGHGYIFRCDTTNDHPNGAINLRGTSESAFDSTGLSIGRPAQVSVLAKSNAVFLVSISGLAPGHALSCRLLETTDDHANSAEGATPLTVGTPMAFRMDTHDDTDVFAFSALAGHIYSMRAVGGTGIVTGSLLSPEGALLTYGEMGATAEAGLTYEVASSGTHHIRVTPSNAAVGDTLWSLIVEDMGLDDAGDDIATATEVRLGATVTGWLHSQGLYGRDLDVFTFPATAGTLYRVKCRNDCYLQGLSPAGQTSWWQRVLQNQLVIEATATGPLFFSIRDAQNAHYSFEVTEEGRDDHGNDATTATPVTSLPAILEGVIEVWQDTDVFSVQLEASRRYRLAPVSTSIAMATPESPSGKPLGKDSAGRFTANETGLWRVRITTGAEQFGPYRFELTAE
ncbi:hypothetical protein JGU66_32075 [Myxococcaceae bacterium JPH2]|nr:hypothetical protein [Myxococcaceae bacterium JPH2]